MYRIMYKSAPDKPAQIVSYEPDHEKVMDALWFAISGDWIADAENESLTCRVSFAPEGVKVILTDKKGQPLSSDAWESPTYYVEECE